MLDDKTWLILYAWLIFLIFLNKTDGQTLDTETQSLSFFLTEGVCHLYQHQWRPWRRWSPVKASRWPHLFFLFPHNRWRGALSPALALTILGWITGSHLSSVFSPQATVSYVYHADTLQWHFSPPPCHPSLRGYCGHGAETTLYIVSGH